MPGCKLVTPGWYCESLCSEPGLSATGALVSVAGYESDEGTKSFPQLPSPCSWFSSISLLKQKLAYDSRRSLVTCECALGVVRGATEEQGIGRKCETPQQSWAGLRRVKENVYCKE